jgi:3-oxoacyl-[acyl-carrier protein] reductase
MSLLVTGGSRGIGRGIVLGALRHGYDVAFTWRSNQEAADETLRLAADLAPDRKCRSYQLDQRDAAAVEEVGWTIQDDFEDLRVVVCNAGVNRDGLAFSMSDEAWREVIDTNLTGSFYIARQFLSPLIASGTGRLIFMSSIATDGLTGQANYAASKAGLLGLMRTLAKEYGRKGVTSNAIVPGFFDTDMTRNTMSAGHQEFWHKFCPVGRMGTLDEVAAAVLFLASEEASFVNGCALPVTGGLDQAV